MVGSLTLTLTLTLIEGMPWLALSEHLVPHVPPEGMEEAFRPQSLQTRIVAQAPLYTPNHEEGGGVHGVPHDDGHMLVATGASNSNSRPPWLHGSDEQLPGRNPRQRVMLTPELIQEEVGRQLLRLPASLNFSGAANTLKSHMPTMTPATPGIGLFVEESRKKKWIRYR